ncbi:aldo/keto reductase [Paenibacillus yanchengensis]|uniref:Aldo/keto reductase n=1 Tax=Paenibacillus yanchengensis TaxID=2035833 RepID=A0ABW4YNT4_9BACL
MTQPLTQSLTLSNGITMPQLGLGVWKVAEEGQAERTVLAALENGYRHIDTAAIYQNEEGVGAALANTPVPRNDIFVTTKIWNEDQGYESALAAFERSQKKLGLDVIDLLLIHWPVKGKYKDTWRALEQIYKDGKVRAIGVSNFHIHHLEDIFATCEIKPMVNQVEYHPLLTQEPLLAFCNQHQIKLTAWSPLMQGNLDIPLLQEIAAKYNKSAAQIVLRWDIQTGVITIPKTVTPARMIENGDVWDFELTTDEIAQISALNQNKRFGADPDNFNF